MYVFIFKLCVFDVHGILRFVFIEEIVQQRLKAVATGRSTISARVAIGQGKKSVPVTTGRGAKFARMTIGHEKNLARSLPLSFTDEDTKSARLAA